MPPDQVPKLSRCYVLIIENEFVPAHAFQRLQVAKVDVLVQVLLVTVDVGGLVIAVEMAWLQIQFMGQVSIIDLKYRIFCLLVH